MESGAISSLLTKGDTGYDSISLECNGVIEQVVRFTKQGIKLGIMLDKPSRQGYMLARMEVGMQLTMHQQNALDFARKYQGWHTFAKDNLTKRVIAQLVNKGLLQANEYQQFSAI